MPCLQIGGVQDALQQLGPWPACVVLAMDLLSSICKLPADFGDLKVGVVFETLHNHKWVGANQQLKAQRCKGQDVLQPENLNAAAAWRYF